jgi:hypothetical protein
MYEKLTKTNIATTLMLIFLFPGAAKQVFSSVNHQSPFDQSHFHLLLTVPTALVK